MKAQIVLLPGDGIGPEVVAVALRVLKRVAESYGHSFEFSEHAIGGHAIDTTGSALPDSTRTACLEADAVLLGAVGGPRWDDPGLTERPEQGLLQLRQELGVFANLRPVRPLPALYQASPLKVERLQGVDLLVVRELTGGIYFGEKVSHEDQASDLCSYRSEEIERVVRIAAQQARNRRGHLTLVDKANVLATSRLWRRVTGALLAEEYPDLSYDQVLVDAAAMHLLNDPQRFDVIVTDNLFGDILTDEAAALSGSLGLLPSASLGDGGPGLFEPIHGSAPDLAGRGLANPCGTVLSAALLLRALGLKREPQAIEDAVSTAIESGVRTADLGGTAATEDMAEAIINHLQPCTAHP